MKLIIFLVACALFVIFYVYYIKWLIGKGIEIRVGEQLNWYAKIPFFVLIAVFTIIFGIYTYAHGMW